MRAPLLTSLIEGDVPALIPQLGPSALLAIAILLVLTGKLVPARQLADVKADRDAWRAAAERKDITIRELMEGSRTTLRVVKSLEEASTQAGQQ